MSVFPPLGAVIIEGITFVAVSLVVIALFIKYIQNRKRAGLILMTAFLFWSASALSSFLGKVYQYMTGQFSYGNIGVTAGYAFSAISNIFIFLYVSQIFSRSLFFSRTGISLPIIFGVFNGITAGLLIDFLLSQALSESAPVGYVAFHLILTILAFSSWGIFAIKPLQEAIFRWEKTGYGLIIASSITGVLAFVFFAIDAILPQIVPESFAGGYTFAYYTGWILAILMCYLAYLGYVMPRPLRDLLREKEPVG